MYHFVHLKNLIMKLQNPCLLAVASLKTGDVGSTTAQCWSPFATQDQHWAAIGSASRLVCCTRREERTAVINSYLREARSCIHCPSLQTSDIDYTIGFIHSESTCNPYLLCGSADNSDFLSVPKTPEILKPHCIIQASEYIILKLCFYVNCLD